MTRLLLLGVIVVGLGAAQAVYYLVRYFYEKQGEELKRRLRTIGEPAAGVQILRTRRLASSQSLNDFLANFDSMVSLEKLLEQTDLEITVAGLLAVSAVLAFAGLMTGLILRSGPLALAIILFGLAAPSLFALAARDKRGKRISEQLPDALEMMARAIKAGHSLPASFKLVAHECPAPVAVEFGRAYEQQNLGIPFEVAVQNMCDRVPGNLDLRLFAVSVMINKETGGNLVEVLENIAATMRERFKFYSKLRALTAEGRVSGYILGAMPYVVAFFIHVTNPGYLAELFTPGGGRMILFGGFFMWSLGVLWIRALLQVEF